MTHITLDNDGNVLAVFGSAQTETVEIADDDQRLVAFNNKSKLRLLEVAVQEHLDAAAVALGFGNIYTACTYAEEPAVQRFQNDGRTLRAWRSLVWAKCYEVKDAVIAGERAMPTEEDLIAELPILGS